MEDIVENFTRIDSRRLTEIEWGALQAALPCKRGGLPMVPGIVDELSGTNLIYKDLFVLRGSCTRQIGATYYVLLGFGDDDDIVPEPLEPYIFGIYSDDHYEYQVPSFEKLYQRGLAKLRNQALQDAMSRSSLIFAGGILIFSVVGPSIFNLGATVLVSITGGLVSYLLNLRKLPRSKSAAIP